MGWEPIESAAADILELIAQRAPNYLQLLHEAQGDDAIVWRGQMNAELEGNA